MENLSLLAAAIIASGVISVVCLLILHFVCPEYKPNWRMVSEYALGKYKWILTLFFIFWGISSILTSILIWNFSTSGWMLFGAVLVFVSGIGATMGGLFDVKHPLHGLSFAIGVPTLPIGALLISYNLVKTESWRAYKVSILLSAHAIWISLIAMAITMMLLFSGFKKAGLPMGPNLEPPTTLPKGVIGINGYANRILILCYIGWLLIIAKTYLSF